MTSATFFRRYGVAPSDVQRAFRHGLAAGDTLYMLGMPFGMHPGEVRRWCWVWSIPVNTPAQMLCRWQRRFDRTHGLGSSARIQADLTESPRTRTYATIAAQWGLTRQRIHQIAQWLLAIAPEQIAADAETQSAVSASTDKEKRYGFR